MILLVVGLVAVIVVVFIAIVLSIRLGHSDEHDEPDVPSRGRDRRADEDEHWRERDTRRAPSASARAARGRDGAGPPRRPARADAAGYRRPAAARSPVPASAQARGRYDTGPQRRHAAGDAPSADYPSMDFGPAGDHPSVDFPAVGYDATDYPEDRPQPRRKAASGNGKSRSRQRGKRGDDDDWPSTDWDKLSDEQYWAELSADKPLAAMAKPSRPAGNSGAKAPVNGSARRGAEPPAAREPRPARAPAAPAREVPGRNERTEPREPATERLPARTRQQPPAPARAARREAGPSPDGSYAANPRAPRDTGPFDQRDPLRDSGPWAWSDTGPQAIRDTGPGASRETRPRPEQPRPIPGALEDDPLTSPSFSLKANTAGDSRSYRGSRRHARTSGGYAAGNGAGHTNGNGSYPTVGYAGAGYGYQAAAPTVPAEQWYDGPPAPAEGQASGYGNPYEAPRHGEPAGPAPYVDGYAQHSYPAQAAYPDGHAADGYSNGNGAGYPGDPYAGGGYGPYRSRG